MVNKAALGVIGVIVIVTVGGGLVLGTMLDGGGDDNEGGAEGPTADETATPTPNDAGGSVNESTPEPVDDRRTPMLPRRFSAEAIEENVTRYLNRARTNETAPRAEDENETLEPIRTDGPTATTLKEMARVHSRSMADAGQTGHAVGATNTSERYLEYDVAESCKYTVNGTQVYHPADHDKFEVLDAGTIGNFDLGGDEEPYVENESFAAKLIVEDMLDDWSKQRRLFSEHIEFMGVGAEIAGENTVYTTVNLCGE